MAKATAASAAAKTIINIVKICPSNILLPKPENQLKATKFKPDAFKMSSTPISIATAFFLVITP